MTDPITPDPTLFLDHKPHRVYTRAAWSGEWTLRPHLYCNVLDMTAAPDVDRADLEHRYGVGLRPGETAFAVVPPLDLVDHYVKVEVETTDGPTLKWYGLIVDEADIRDGAEVTGEGDEQQRVGSGIQHWVAYGLEIELDRVRIESSVVKTADGEQTVGRAIGFNLGQGQSTEIVAGNQHAPALGSKGPVFAEKLDADTAEPWDAARIIRYLFAYHAPADKAGEPWLPLLLTGQDDAISWHEPQLVAEGRTVRQLLNELIDRRRLAGWRIEVEEREPTLRDLVKVVVFSLAEAPVSLTDDATLPANPDPVSLDFDIAANILHASVRSTAALRYDQVIVRGERRGACFSVGGEEETIVRDWTDAEEEAYERGASDADGIPGELDQRKAWHDDARNSDAVRRAFAHFSVPDDWDGLTAGGEGGLPHPACPQLDPETGEPGGSVVPFWRPGLFAVPRLPLVEGRDYSGDPLGEDPDTAPLSAIPEPLPVLSVFKVGEGDGPYAVPRYAHAEALATTLNDDDDPRGWSVSVRVQDHSLGVVLKVNVSGYQHAFAGDDFTPLIEDAQILNVPELDWHDNLILTLAVPWDERVEARFPADADLPDGRLRRLEIRVPGARLDWLAPGTVVRLDDAGRLVRSEGGFLRDDRPLLERIARLAHGWYSTPRRLFDLSYRDISGRFRVGQLVTTIGAAETEQEINTTITSVQLDLLHGVTTVRTQFAELDVTAL